MVLAPCANILALLALTIRYAVSLCPGIKNARSSVENRQVLIEIPQWSSFIRAAFSFTLNIFAQLPFQSVCCPEAKASQQCCLDCCQECSLQVRSSCQVCVYLFAHKIERFCSVTGSNAAICKAPVKRLFSTSNLANKANSIHSFNLMRLQMHCGSHHGSSLERPF